MKQRPLQKVAMAPWTMDAKTRWRDVTITYDLTNRLRHGLTPEDLKKLPLHPR
jgi:hypothetical protein